MVSTISASRRQQQRTTTATAHHHRSIKRQSLIGFASICLALFLAVEFVWIPWFLHEYEQQQEEGRKSYRIGGLLQPPIEKQQQKQPPPPTTTVSSAASDGTFNGAPVILRTTTQPESSAHCIGDNYDAKTAWMGRSCHFSFLCWDLQEREFVVFESPQERFLRQLADSSSSPNIHISSTLMTSNGKYPTVSLGGLNIKWGAAGMQRLEWFPLVRRRNVSQQEKQQPLVYYELPPNAVLVPFHSMNGANPGHLVWDDFLSLYTLLDMFDLLEGGYQWLLLRMILPAGRQQEQQQQRGLWASCDFTPEKTQSCHAIMNKFMPLFMGTHPTYHWSTTHNISFVASSSTTSEAQQQQQPQSNLVCARHGVAGIGSLTDHGYLKAHGWVPEDYNITHNHGRGGMLRRFRKFCLDNLNLPPLPSSTQLLERPYRIVFSVNSSDIPARVEDFQTQIQFVRTYLPTHFSSSSSVVVESYNLQHLTLLEQMELARQTSVFVTMCGGGAVTAMFLPPGASVILYYHERGGVRGGRHGNEYTQTPALLDWDLFNSMTHLRVHWMPKLTMNQMADLMALIALIQHELRWIQSNPFGRSRSSNTAPTHTKLVP